MSILRRAVVAIVLCGPLALLSGCAGGADKATGPTTPPVDLTKPTNISAVAGTGQTVRISSAVPTAVDFKVTNATGSGLSGIAVNFAVTAGGGTLASATGTTGADGSVTAPTWTVGPTAIANTLSATVSGSITASATVTGRLPYWTVMVYMAADNTLAPYGALNLYQMAAAGVNPEVQVVVQAEFNPEAFAEQGWTPTVVDRPNFDTFRYVMNGTTVSSPNHVFLGPTTDIGNVNMTDPATLRAFVQYAEQVAPSEHTVLVLWNHGGDEVGLIEDATSAPGTAMTLSQLTSALTGLPPVDVLYFEMCLMGGYEPLLAVHNLAQTAVASEDAEYVAGWNFTSLLQALYADPTVGATTAATRLADAFDAAYASLGFSETIAAYNLAGFPAVDAAVSQLASALGKSPSVTASGLGSSVARVQRYDDMPWIADLVDLTDTLRARYSDSSIVAAAVAVRSAVTAPSFLLTSHYRSGTAYYQPNEARSHGLTIVMPAIAPYSMPSEGTGSVADYQQQFPSAAWGTFLQDYSSGLQTEQFTNIGAKPLTIYQVWDTVFAKEGWLEMLLVEPDGGLYSPIFGSLSPSGQFSADAQLTKAYYEGWASNQYVETGTYYYLAWLVADPENYQPGVDIQYRLGDAALTSLYSPGPYPRLSLQTSFRNDPNFSLANALNGAYSDLRWIATWTTTSASGDVAELGLPGLIDQTHVPQITAQQIAALRRIASELLPPKARAGVKNPVPLHQNTPRPLIPTPPGGGR